MASPETRTLIDYLQSKEPGLGKNSGEHAIVLQGGLQAEIEDKKVQVMSPETFQANPEAVVTDQTGTYRGKLAEVLTTEVVIITRRPPVQESIHRSRTTTKGWIVLVFHYKDSLMIVRLQQN